MLHDFFVVGILKYDGVAGQKKYINLSHVEPNPYRFLGKSQGLFRNE